VQALLPDDLEKLAQLENKLAELESEKADFDAGPEDERLKPS